MEYQVNELEEMISNLKKVKNSSKWGLSDENEIELTTFELILEDYLVNKWLNKLTN
tara:strand:+ start:276 stop:443 length:168 start_codon:yes stop_codon:yes gene_type:complete